MKFIFVADAFIEDGILGGGEMNNHELMNLLVVSGLEVMKVNSQFLEIEMLQENSDDAYIISNFINLPEDSKKYLATECKYVIYEHDHKYLTTRNPAVFEDYIAPPEAIVNKEFYANALAVFCQSSKHADVVKKNLKLDNIVSVSGNLWPEEILNLIEELSEHKKNNCVSIMNSPIAHKSTRDSIMYCKARNLNYELIDPCRYDKFITQLSKNDSLAFFPKTLETLCRVVVEARMLGCKIITNHNVSATEEDWFSLKGKDLIDIMRDKRDTIPKMVISKFM
jgi:hypothetical protein